MEKVLLDKQSLLGDLNRELAFNRNLNNEDRMWHLLTFITQIESGQYDSKEASQ